MKLYLYLLVSFSWTGMVIDDTFNVSSVADQRSIASSGESLFLKHCASCHRKEFGKTRLKAPLLLEIKQAYSSHGEDLQAFSENIIAFISNPSKVNSKMPEAIATYGIMSKQRQSIEDQEEIMKYIYSWSE